MNNSLSEGGKFATTLHFTPNLQNKHIICSENLRSPAAALACKGGLDEKGLQDVHHPLHIAYVFLDNACVQ